MYSTATVLSVLAVMYHFSSLVDLSRTKTVTRKVVQCRVFEECVLISWNERQGNIAQAPNTA